MMLHVRHVRWLEIQAVPVLSIPQLDWLKTHAARVQSGAHAVFAPALVRLLVWMRRGIDALAAVKSAPSRDTTSQSELRRALFSCKSAFVGIAIFSGLINILMLTGSLFMLEVY